MASFKVVNLLQEAYYWRIPVVVLCIFICGFLITFSPKRGLRIFGIWVILEAITTGMSSIEFILQYLYHKKIITSDFYINGPYVNLITNIGIISFFMNIILKILMWLYAKRNYGTKKAPIIVILSLVISSIIARFVINAYFKDLGQMGSLLNVLTISEAAFGIMITTIYLIIFFKNRSIERNIPNFWIFHLYGLITAVISIPLEIKLRTDYNNDNFVASYMLICILFSIITICFYTYFTIRAYKREEIQAWN